MAHPTVKVEVDAPLQQMTPSQQIPVKITALATLRDRCQGKTQAQQVQILEKATEIGEDFLLNVGKVLRKHTKDVPSCGDREKAINQIHARKRSTQLLIGIIGNTGDGKSSLINCLLELEHLLPNSAEMACTAVTVEISWNLSIYPERAFLAKIYGISHQEWRKELKDYYEDARTWKVLQETNTTDEDPEILERMDCVLAKLKHIYPKIRNHDDVEKTPVEELMSYKPVKALLDRVVSIESSNLAEFRDLVRSYIDTSTSKDEDGYNYSIWPLIKVVKIAVKANILKHGITLVDLPGTQDTSAARSNIAAEYLKNIDIACVLTRATRAANDKGAQDALSQEARRTMQLDGIYSNKSLFFIISQSDNCIGGNIDEMLKYFREHKELKEKWTTDIDQYHTLSDQVRILKIDQEKHEKQLVKDKKPMEKLERKYKALETKVRKIGLPKYSLKRSFTEYAAEEVNLNLNNATEDQLAQVEAFRQLVKELQGIKAQFNENEINIEWQKRERQLKRTRVALRNCVYRLTKACIQNRSEVQTTAIKAHFEENRQKIGGTQSDNILQVFSTSSTAFMKIMNGHCDDAMRDGFSDIDDTGIPALQEALMAITLDRREQLSHAFLEDISSTVAILRMWAQDTTSDFKLKPEEKSVVEIFINTALVALEKKMETINVKVIADIQDLLQSALYSKLKLFEVKAAFDLKKVVIGWQQPPVRANTHRAINKRNGEWKSSVRVKKFDWNEDMTHAYLGYAVPDWDRTFHNELPIFRNRHINGTERLVGEFYSNLYISIESVSPGLAIQLHLMKDSILKTHRFLRSSTVDIFKKIEDVKKSAHRLVKPEVLRSWIDTYEECAAMKGKGLYLMLKDAHNSHADNEGGPQMYERASEQIETTLAKFCETFPELFGAGFDLAKGQISEELKVLLERYSASGERTSERRAPDKRKKALLHDLEPLLLKLEEALMIEIAELEPKAKKKALSDSSDDEDENDEDEDEDEDEDKGPDENLEMLVRETLGGE